MKVPRLTAAARIAAIREEISDGALRLAYHAAVPVVIDATLLNLLRVNFFLDPPDAIPHETEAALLLSPLFREIGEELYEIEPDVRNLLLTGLYSRYGTERVHRVALLLEQYTEATLAWHAQPELERAQQLAALSFVDPARALRWLDDADSGAAPHALGREWYVAMHRRITEQSTVTTATEEIARALAQLTDSRGHVRVDAIRTLAALTRLPEADPAPAVAALAEFIRDGTRRSGGEVAADIRAALTLIGTLPHDDSLSLAGIKLIGADLSGLDFSRVRFTDARLIKIKALAADLTGARLRGALIRDSVMDGARLDHADLRAAVLDNVSLRDATISYADLNVGRIQNVDLSRADLRGTALDVFESDNVRLDDVITNRNTTITFKAIPFETIANEEGARAAEEAAVLGEPGRFPRAALDLGRSLEEQGDLEGARAAYREAAASSGDPDVALAAIMGLGSVYLRTGEYPEAKGVYYQALPRYRAGGDLRGEARALAGLGWAELETGHLDHAMERYEQVLSIFREIGDRHGEAETLTNLGLVNNNRGAYEEAGRCFEQALMLYRETSDRHGEGNAHYYLGMVNAHRGVFDQAAVRYEQALDIFTQLGERRSRADVLAELGIIDIQSGPRDRLFNRSEEALMIFREIGDNLSTVRFLRRMALAYKQTGDLDQAIRLYEQSVADGERILGPDHPDTQISQDYLANLYRAAGRADDAFQLHSTVLASRRRTLGDDHPDTLTSASNLAADLRALGRYDEALVLDRDTYERRRRVLGEDHPDTLASASRLDIGVRGPDDARRDVAGFPTVMDYFTAVQAPDLAFTVPELRTAKFAWDKLGPKAMTGRSTVVFRAEVAGRPQAVRCYTRSLIASPERYAALGAFLAGHDLRPHVSATTWLDSGIRVNGATWPVLLMDWIDGRNLHEYVRFLVEESRTAARAALAQRWRGLIRRLQQAEFAHGGLQHDDVLIDQEGQLRLVDYDVIWIPSIQHLKPPSEPGHIHYEHPGGRVWGRWMDTFPALVIYLSLVALAKDRALWRFHEGDNLLFHRTDFRAPFETPVWRQLAALNDPEVSKLTRRLQECCAPDWVAAKSLDETIADA